MARRSNQQPPPEYPPPAAQGYPQGPQPGYPPQGGYVPPGYELKRKKPIYKRVWFWLLVIFVIVIIAVVAGISSAVNDATNKPHTVVYTVTGTGIAKADVTYYVSDGSNNSSNESADNQPLPWTKTITVKGDLSGFVLTANTPITGQPVKGTLSCSLSVDGKVVSTDKSSGNTISLVTCSGSGYGGN